MGLEVFHVVSEQAPSFLLHKRSELHCSPPHTHTHTHTHTQYIADIEEHLGVTVPEVSKTFEVPVNEFDGKVTYGERRRQSGVAHESHVAQLAASVAQLARMEQLAQTTFLKMQSQQEKWFL